MLALEAGFLMIRASASLRLWIDAVDSFRTGLRRNQPAFIGAIQLANPPLLPVPVLRVVVILRLVEDAMKDKNADAIGMVQLLCCRCRCGHE
jgi:hypothetical protein